MAWGCQVVVRESSDVLGGRLSTRTVTPYWGSEEAVAGQQFAIEHGR